MSVKQTTEDVNRSAQTTQEVMRKSDTYSLDPKLEVIRD